MTVKRNRDFDDTEIERMAMANCLMLSGVRKSGSDNSSEPGRLFHCKTCNRPFKSFQALGGHRASHKRMKLNDFLGQWKVKSTHECSVCGMEFAIGQALGGHMRRHRDEGVGKGVQDVTVRMTPVKKQREIRGFCFDLNLMPYENELTLWPMVSG